MNEALHLAELFCARLCHDLSGPLGALIGVLEIARDEQPDSEALALAEGTAVELAQRLKLLRAAWGEGGEDLDVPRLSGFADGLAAGRRVHLELGGLAADAVFPGPAARVVLNLVLLAAECLPGGGAVALSGSPAHGLLVTISGPRAAWPTCFGNWLNDEVAATRALIGDPRRLQAPLTALLGRQPGMRLSMLMPTGPAGSATAPPLLLSLR
jgi:histidine phosphotransferase ChpT